MICPTCNAVVDVLEGTCPTCQPATAVIVESTLAGIATARAGVSAPPRGAIAPDRAPIIAPQRMPPRLAARPAHPVLGAASRLPALLWRQPVVRAAVRTGASAVALSLAARMIEHAVASRGTRAAAGESALPALADLLAPRAPTRRSSRRARSRSADVTETFIYIRRESRP